MSHNPPYNPIYPQAYNPANAPPPQVYPTQPGGNPYMNQPGFWSPYPGHTEAVPVPLGPLPVLPTAPPSYGFHYPGVTLQPGPEQIVEWIPTTSSNASALADRAIVAGYEGHDGSPLWVIRGRFKGDVTPGKLAIKHKVAYIAWGGNEISLQQIEVCCARPEKVRWVQSSNGDVPPNAVPGGSTSSGETLYIGRAKHQGSITPGKVHQSHKVLYIPFAGKEWPHKEYEVLCVV